MPLVTHDKESLNKSFEVPKIMKEFEIINPICLDNKGKIKKYNDIPYRRIKEVIATIEFFRRNNKEYNIMSGE